MQSDDSIPVPSAPGQLEALLLWSGLAVAVLITFVFVRIAVLNVFYTTGDMHDGAWLASVAWHNHWRLNGPPAFSIPFFAEHWAPILWITNAVSFVSPVPKFDYFAALIGATHALYAAGIYRAWLLLDTRVTPVRVLVALLVALGAAFSAVPMEALRLPHWELTIPAFALWFLIAVSRHQYRAAACWLIACLISREDAGFHLSFLLFAWTAVEWLRRRALNEEMRRVAGFGVLAFAYSVAAFAAKRHFFPFGDVLTTSYLGDPPLAHVTGTFLWERLTFFVQERSYLTLPMLIGFVWAALARDPLLPLGYVSVIPWLTISFLAVHITPGGLNYYYGFPFWLSLAWPLIGLRVWNGSKGRRDARWPYLAMVLTSLVFWRIDHVMVAPLMPAGSGDLPLEYHETIANRATNEAFAQYFLDYRKRFGGAMFDQAFFALVIDRYDRDTWLETLEPDQTPETLIYYTGSYEFHTAIRRLLATSLYRCIYTVPGTRIDIATQDSLVGRPPKPWPFVLKKGLPGAGC